MTTPEERAAIERAEVALARRDHGWPGSLVDLLHPAFEEVGASGRRWTRQELAAWLSADAGSAPGEGRELRLDGLRVDGLRVDDIAPDVVLVTYRTTDRGPGGRVVRRASIWVRGDGVGWRIRYHQGTVVPAPEGPTGA